MFCDYETLFAIWAGVVVGCIGYAMILARDHDRPWLAGLLIGVAWAHCGFLQHMGGHHELGGASIPWQHLFEGLGGPVFQYFLDHKKECAQFGRCPICLKKQNQISVLVKEFITDNYIIKN